MYAANYEPNRALYSANVTELDYETGRLLRTLDELGLRNDTIVLFTSDNGPEVLNRERAPWTARSYGTAGRLRGMKLDLYEGGIRVPALLRWPGVIKAGRTNEAVVSMLDILPTFCDLAGVATPAGLALDGVSLRGFLRGGTLRRSAPLYWQYDNAHTSEPNNLPVPKLALRDGKWKLLARIDFSAAELYDLQADPREQRSLAAQQRTRTAMMLHALQQQYAEINASAPPPPSQAVRSRNTRK
jgi:arylsulfatase A